MEQRQIQRQLKTDLLMSGLALVSISIGLYEIGCPRPVTGMTSLDWLDLGIVAGILQILGIAFIGIFAGSMANAIIKESPEQDGPDTPEQPPSKDA